MASSGMLRRVALVRADVSEELSASFIKVTRIGGLGRALVLTSNRRTLRRLLVTASVVPLSPILVILMEEALNSSETPVLKRATRRNIPEHAILHIYRRDNLKSYLNKNTRLHTHHGMIVYSHRSENLSSIHPLWFMIRGAVNTTFTLLVLVVLCNQDRTNISAAV
jgi:hypothetical protein